MKTLLLLAPLGLVSLPATTQAQSFTTTIEATHTALPPAAPDTVAAIHRLFAARRQQRNFIAFGAVAVAGIGAGVTSTRHDGFFSGGDYAKMYSAGAAAAILVDFVIGDSHSRKNEQRALDDFQAHRLSRHAQRQLKAKYFR